MTHQADSVPPEGLPQAHGADRRRPKVGLFVTCLVNTMRPSIGFAAVKLLEQAGCEVEVPASQSCCGQPAYNNGDYDTTRSLARQVIEAFEGYDYVVGPSGSCMSTIRNDYPRLMADDPAWSARADALAQRSHELMSFLVDVLHAAPSAAALEGQVTYHDSCSGLRGLGIKAQPRELLAGVDGLQLTEMADTEVCCGFGGTFCVKYPEISTRMADDKLAHASATGADTLLGGDLSCLLHLAGRARRQGLTIRVFHAAEVLAGMARGQGIGAPEDEGES